MKINFSILCMCVLFLTSCKGNKNGESGALNFSNKNTAAQIITYYNLIIDYDANASGKISRLLDGDLKVLDKMVTAKSSKKGIITWTTFVGIDPRVEKWSGSTKVNLLKPEALLDKEMANKVLPLVKEMNNAYKETKKNYLEFKKYYNNEDYKDDNWKKGAELIQIIGDKSKAYYENRNGFYKVFETVIDKAEEDVLADHPIRDEIIHAKRTLKLIDQTIALLQNPETPITDIEENYKKLENRFNESKKMDLAKLTEQKKDRKFTSFYGEVDEFLGAVRKVKRDGKIEDREYKTVYYKYKNVISDYNSFVK